MAGFLKRFSKRTIQCPGCFRPIQIVLQPGKRLRIKCKKCKAQFEMEFQNPIRQLLGFKKGLKLSTNLGLMRKSLGGQPFQIKLILFLLISLFTYITYLLSSWLVSLIIRLL